MTLTSFQQDLKNGMTIHDALCKHGLTFRQAVLGVSRPMTEKKPQYPRSRCGEKYILRQGEKYHLRKRQNGRTMMFGTYNTLDDAVRIRDYCIKYGWKQKNIDKYCQELGIERSKGHPNCKVRYH